MNDRREVTEADLDATIARAFGHAPPPDPAKSTMTLEEAQDMRMGHVFNRPGITAAMAREAKGVIAESDRVIAESDRKAVAESDRKLVALANEVITLTESRLGISAEAATQHVILGTRMVFQSKGIAGVLEHLQARRSKLCAQVPLAAGRSSAPGPAGRLAEAKGHQGPQPTPAQFTTIREAFNARIANHTN